MADFASLYPFQVFLDLYGLPLEDRDLLIGWKDTIIARQAHSHDRGDIDKGHALMDYLTEAIQQRRQNPGSDMLSQVMTGAGDFSDLELLGMSHLLILAGSGHRDGGDRILLVRSGTQTGPARGTSRQPQEDKGFHRRNRPTGAIGAGRAPGDHRIRRDWRHDVTPGHAGAVVHGRDQP